MGLYVIVGETGVGVVERFTHLRSKPGIVSGLRQGISVGWTDENGYRSSLAINDDFGASTNVRENSSKVANCLSLRDVDDRHSQDDTSAQNDGCEHFAFLCVLIWVFHSFKRG